MSKMLVFCLFFVATLEYTVCKNVNTNDGLTNDMPEQRSLKRAHYARKHFRADALQERLSIDPSLAGHLHNEALDRALGSSDPKEAMYEYISNLVPAGIPRNIYDSVIDEALTAAGAYQPEADNQQILRMINDRSYQDLYNEIKYALSSNTNSEDFSQNIDAIVNRASFKNRNSGPEMKIVGEIAKGSYNYWTKSGYMEDEYSRAMKWETMACVVLADVAGAIFGGSLFPPPFIGAIWVGATFSLGAAIQCEGLGKTPAKQ
jgi:hypothetical protein